MAMSFAESAALMNDPAFRNRVKVAAIKYAEYIFLQAGNSNSRTNWSQRTMQQPDQTALTLTPNVVMNVNVQNAGAAITDPELSSAVQVTADMMM